MPKYQVTIIERKRVVLEVYADNADEALDTMYDGVETSVDDDEATEVVSVVEMENTNG